MMAAVVAAMTLGELLGPAAGPHAAIRVTDLVSDSQAVTPGAAFVALAGQRHHGLEFAGAALQAGAGVVLYEPDGNAVPSLPGPMVAVPGLRAELGNLGRRFFGRPNPPDGLIGVTGTNGKTTVAWLVAQGLTALGEPCGYLGTIGYGRTDSLRRQALTTPDCLSLHRTLAEIGLGRTALEVSSHALSQDRIAGLGFATAVFTNLSHDHLDWHGTMADYFDAKSRLFSRDGLEVAVVNVDDAYGRTLLGRLTPGTRVIATSTASGSSADLTARTESRGLSGLKLSIASDGGQATIESCLIGDFNAENLLLAAGVLVAHGHDIQAAASVLGDAAPAPGRMEVFGGASEQPWIVVDYAHTPDALDRVLSFVAPLGPVTCVFGCGGERDRQKRAAMGSAAAAHAGKLVLTDDNPRAEDPAAIVADIRSGIPAGTDVRVEHDRELAIRQAIAGSARGDIVLIAGKGHETRQLVGNAVREFDDRAVVERALGSAS